MKKSKKGSSTSNSSTLAPAQGGSKSNLKNKSDTDINSSNSGRSSRR